MGQGVELDRTLGKFRPVERNTAAQHATQVFAGLEHLLEDGLALAQWRVRIHAAAGGQRQSGQQYNSQFFKSHGGSGSRETAASIPAPPGKTNSPINNMDACAVIGTGYRLGNYLHE